MNVKKKSYPKYINLQFKLMLIFAILVFSVIGSFGFYWIQFERQRLLHELELQAKYIVDLLGGTLTVPLWRYDLDSINTQLNSVMLDSRISSVFIYEEGRDSPLIERWNNSSPLINSISHEKQITYLHDPVTSDIRKIGKIKVVYSSHQAYMQLDKIQMWIILVMLSMVFVLLSTTYLLISQMVQKPIEKLITMTNKITSGDYSNKLTIKFNNEIGILVDKFNCMTDKLKYTMETLYKSEERLLAVQRVAHVGSWEWIHKTDDLWCSEEAFKLFGYKNDTEYINSKIFLECVHPDDREALKLMTKNALHKNAPYNVEYRIILPSGEERVMHSLATLFFDDEKQSVVFLGTTRDITENKQVEMAIKSALYEKEILLREVYHRVKNNLQVISSLLNLQARALKDKNIAECFIESQTRIDSMALIHEKLYKSKDLAKINFTDYVPKLLESLFISYGTNSNNIIQKIIIENVHLSIDTAVPLGLILNEIISNCMKHAFPKVINPLKKFEISIHLRLIEDSIYSLTVTDNGKGLPDNFNINNIKTLGMTLINTLVRQLEGIIKIENINGTKINIVFKELKYRKRV